MDTAAALTPQAPAHGAPGPAPRGPAPTAAIGRAACVTSGGRGAALGPGAWGWGGARSFPRGLPRRVVGSGVWARGVTADLWTLEACRSTTCLWERCLGKLSAGAGAFQSRKFPGPGADFGTQPNPRICDWAALSTLRENHRIILIEHRFNPVVCQTLSWLLRGFCLLILPVNSNTPKHQALYQAYIGAW